MQDMFYVVCVLLEYLLSVRQNSSSECVAKNYVFVFTGRWKYLRIQFPYLFANLRKNGGVIDHIHYIMIGYDPTTRMKLENLATVVRNWTGDENTLVINYLGYPPGQPPRNPKKGPYAVAYYDYIKDLAQHSCNKYFKIDDDVVYIHPGTFENVLSREDGARCAVRFANTAGANWRCSYIHQAMGVYNDRVLNPNELKFEFKTNGKCGWGSLDCAKLSLDTFLALYQRRQLDRFLFNSTYVLSDKRRFSINFFLLDNESIDLKALLEAWPISDDDEEWWTTKYVRKTDPHCVVGKSLVVHFSYYKTVKGLEALNMIKEFEVIVVNELFTKVPQIVWSALGL